MNPRLTRVEVNVRAAQVEQPRDLVQHRHHEPLRLLLTQLLAQTCNLLHMPFPGVLGVQIRDRGVRSARTVLAPDDVDDVVLQRHDFRAKGGKGFREVLRVDCVSNVIRSSVLGCTGAYQPR